MDNLINNIPLIIVAISAIIVSLTFIINFFQKPTPQQYEQIFAWLLYAVTLAEREFGSKMGKLKLRYVYDMFLTKFGDLAKLISFEKFSELVDKALEEMKHLLESNKKAQEYVGVSIQGNKEGTLQENTEESK